MQTQITVTLTQEEALVELRKSISNAFSHAGIPYDVSVVVIGINDDQEGQRRAIIKRCRKYIDAGSKIEAIREFRQSTGAGLKDAKDIMDSETKMEKYIRTGEI